MTRALTQKEGFSPMRRIVPIFAILTLLMGLVAAQVTATVSTVGTWTMDPPQTFTDSSVPTTTTSYKAAVRGAVNADGTSNFSAKKGVVPVQFDLLAAPATTTATTRTYAPPVWESVQSTGTYSVADLSLDPATVVTFNDITNLSATYLFTEGTCHGGSLRWTLDLVHDGVIQSVHVYYGDPNQASAGQECSINSGSGQNLITTSTVANRFEMAGFGLAPVYNSYATTQGIVGNDRVLAVRLVLDSGWGGTQRADVSNITVNNNTFVPKTTEVLASTTITGDYAKTCALPDARLTWSKNGGASGSVNEKTSIQKKDSGEFFRQVDCKYIYNLSVSSLSGAGRYSVNVNIGGMNVHAPGIFGLR